MIANKFKNTVNSLSNALNSELSKHLEQNKKKHEDVIEIDSDNNYDKENPNLIFKAPLYIDNKNMNDNSSDIEEVKDFSPPTIQRLETTISIQEGMQLGFKLLSPEEKRGIFNNGRDDLFYKTFARDVRKFWQDSMIAFTGYKKEDKGRNGTHFYQCCRRFVSHIQLHKVYGLEKARVTCFIGSLINHREFKKACPNHLIDLSYQIYNTFNMFTKEKLFNLCQSDEFKVLFKRYVSVVNESNNFERLRTHQTIGKNLAPYLFVYKEF